MITIYILTLVSLLHEQALLSEQALNPSVLFARTFIYCLSNIFFYNFLPFLTFLDPRQNMEHCWGEINQTFLNFFHLLVLCFALWNLSPVVAYKTLLIKREHNKYIVRKKRKEIHYSEMVLRFQITLVVLLSSSKTSTGCCLQNVAYKTE